MRAVSDNELGAFFHKFQVEVKKREREAEKVWRELTTR